MNEILAYQQSLKINGKSFNWAAYFLNSKQAEKAAVLYSFCRVLDDLADEEGLAGFDRLQRIKNDLQTGRKPSDKLHLEFNNFIKSEKLPIPVLLELVNGLLLDREDVAICDENALLRYAYQVAGTVGILMCFILGYNKPKAFSHAIDLGIAMQLTNISRDILEDAQMGRRYIPANWVDGLDRKEILSAAKKHNSEECRTIQLGARKLVELAEQYYESGINGLIYLPPRSHISIGIAARVYRQIGIQLARNDFAWYQGRQVTSKYSKLLCSILAVPNFMKRVVTINPDKVKHNDTLHDALIGLPYVSGN
jgi:phytoene synthase